MRIVTKYNIFIIMLIVVIIGATMYFYSLDYPIISSEKITKLEVIYDDGSVNVKGEDDIEKFVDLINNYRSKPVFNDGYIALSRYDKAIQVNMIQGYETKHIIIGDKGIVYNSAADILVKSISETGKLKQELEEYLSGMISVPMQVIVEADSIENPYEEEVKKLKKDYLNLCEKQNKVEKKNKLIGDDRLFVDNMYNPIVVFMYRDAKKAEDGILLGGFYENQWKSVQDAKMTLNGEELTSGELLDTDIDRENINIDMLTGLESYRVYGKQGFISKIQTSKYVCSANGSSLDKMVNIHASKIDTDEDILIGINGQWNAMPRNPVSISDSSYILDLNNDGKYEQITLEIKEEEVDGFESPKRAELKVTVDGEETLIDNAIIDGTYQYDYQILMQDLNGDSKIEIIAVRRGHNSSVRVYELKSDTLECVLTYHNGD